MRERDANWYSAKCSSTLVPFMAFFITTYFGFSTFPTENEQIVVETAPLIPTDQLSANGVVNYGVLWHVEKSALRCLSTCLYYRK